MRALRDVELTSGRHGLRQRRPACQWRSTPTSPRASSSAFLTDYPVGELLSYKGIAEGSENSNFLLHTTDRRLHPDALREAGRPRRPAVLPRPDGASGQEGHHLPAAGRTGATAAVIGEARRPAGGADHLPRRHVDAPADRRPLPRGRQGAGRAASRRRRFSAVAAERAAGSTAGASCGTASRAAPTRSSRASPPRSMRISRARRATGRTTCRPASSMPTLSRQRVLPRRPAVGADRLLFRLQRFLRLRRRHLPQRLVLREGLIPST